MNTAVAMPPQHSSEDGQMRQIVVDEWMTLDGVVQAPSYPEEDTEGGFEHGGWHGPFFDVMSEEWVVAGITGAGGYLFGRRTYESFAAHWPNASKEEQKLAQPLNTRPKYVVSSTLSEPLAWENTRLIQGDAVDAISALKREEGGDIHVIGSTELVRALIEHRMVDRFRLMIDPIVVGGGKRIFRDDGELRSMVLTDCGITTTGAILATYVISGAVEGRDTR